MDMKFCSWLFVSEMHLGRCYSSVLRSHTSHQIFILCCDHPCDLCVFPVSSQQVVWRVHLQWAERCSLAVWHSWNHEGEWREPLLYSGQYVYYDQPAAGSHAVPPSVSVSDPESDDRTRSDVSGSVSGRHPAYVCVEARYNSVCGGSGQDRLPAGNDSSSCFLNEQREHLHSFISTVS